MKNCSRCVPVFIEVKENNSKSMLINLSAVTAVWKGENGLIDIDFCTGKRISVAYSYDELADWLTK